MRRNKKVAMFLVGTMAMTGVSAVSLTDIFSNVMTVQAALQEEFSTENGVAVLGSGEASITITGNPGQTLVGKEFTVYRLFDAENSNDGESINYVFSPFYEDALKKVVGDALSKSPDEVTEYMVIDYIQSLNTNPVEGAAAEQTDEGAYSEFRYFIETLRDELENQNYLGLIVQVTSTRNDNSVLLSGLEYGYYVIDENSAVETTHSASSLCMVNTANPEAFIDIKSDYPTVTKKIKEDDVSDDISDENGWNDIADYEIGQKVPFKYESNISDMNGYHSYYYAWHDVMDEALTFQPDSVGISIAGELEDGTTKIYQLTSDEFKVITSTEDEDTFEIVVDDIKTIVDREFDRMNDLNENIYGQSVVLTYDSILNDNAASRTGRAGFENDVRLEFSNNPDSNGEGSTGFTPWDTVVCFTYKINVLKTNNHDLALEGAKFRLYSDEACTNEVYVKEGNDGYVVVNRDLLEGTEYTDESEALNAVEMKSSSDGTFTIYGLDSGTYYLKETDAPEGYRALTEPIVVEVNPTYTDERDSYVKGEGATTETLQNLEAAAYMKTFYNGLTEEETKELITDVDSGTLNLTVVNQTGVKLPVTGTPALIVMFTIGAGMMTYAIVSKRKKNERI